MLGLIPYMAFYHKTLEDLEKAILREDWKKAKKIMQKHNRFLDHEEDKIKHEISMIGSRIIDFGQNMDQAADMLKEVMDGDEYWKHELLNKVKYAKNHALFFEETLKQLVKEGKFLE